MELHRLHQPPSPPCLNFLTVTL
ncbi:hypothetical protein A2U01_0094354, partial [Trifolium medium]|nr:hypothetical protein [Trifolium medium]